MGLEDLEMAEGLEGLEMAGGLEGLDVGSREGWRDWRV